MAKLGQGLRAARELGVRPLIDYAAYWVRLRSGVLRRNAPVFEWSARPLAAWLKPGVPADAVGFLRARSALDSGGFFFPASETPATLSSALSARSAEVQREAEAILEGRVRLFGGTARKFGWPPLWRSPAQERARHWSKVDLESTADIRLDWEPARFGFVFPLVGAYRLRGDARYFEAFWQGFDSFREAWPANAGPHWASGQEVALRGLALTFAWFGFHKEFAARPSAAADLAACLAAHAHHIPPTLGYARAQRNNHLLSEAAALYTIGGLFPEFQGAEGWRRLGKRELLRALADQVFADGGYIQYSTRYQRLALDLVTWCARLAQIQRDPWPDSGLQAAARLTMCLAALVDPETGAASNLGNNDGSLLLPIAPQAGADYRFTVQAAGWVFGGGLAFPPGAWDEAAGWLGIEAQAQKDNTDSLRDDLPDLGVHILRSDRGRAHIRCVHFSARPAQSDQLHVELWHGGSAVVLDPGTNRYRAPDPWDNALSAARAHNGPVLDGEEPMARAGRFLWQRWAQGRVIGRWASPGGELETVLCEHDGYRRRGVIARRAVVRLGQDGWWIADELTGDGAHALSSRWLLPAGDWTLSKDGAELTARERLKIRVSATGCRVGVYREGRLTQGEPVESDPATLGWFSPTYDALEPAVTLSLHVTGELPLLSEVGVVSLNTIPPHIIRGQGSSLVGAIVEWGGARLRLG